MEIVASAKYLRISPKKVRELAHAVVGLPPKQALDRLILLGTKRSRLLAGIIKSAVSNATNNSKLDSVSLRIKTIQVGKGPFFKRYQPVSRGMAHQIKKRTSHIKVILEEIKDQPVHVSKKTKVKKISERSTDGT